MKIGRNCGMKHQYMEMKLLKIPQKKVFGTELEESTWGTLNRIRTHQGKCGSCLFKWGIIESPCCDCEPLLFKL